MTTRCAAVTKPKEELYKHGGEFPGCITSSKIKQKETTEELTIACHFCWRMRGFFKGIYVYNKIYILIAVIVFLKVLNLEESRVEYMEGSGERKRRGKCNEL